MRISTTTTTTTMMSSFLFLSSIYIIKEFFIKKEKKSTTIERNNVDCNCVGLPKELLSVDLPKELLSLVLSKLPLHKDRKNFRLVCKFWNAVVTNSPWLMFYERSKRSWKFIQPNGDDILYKSYSKIYNAEIRCSKYGWLLMSGSNDDHSLFFFDPSNNKSIELPKMDCCYKSLSFFHPPTSPHCFIFGITNINQQQDDPTEKTLISNLYPPDDNYKTVLIGMLKPGKDKWTSYSFTNNLPFKVSICKPVFFDRYVYCLDMNGNIGMLDLILGFAPFNIWLVFTNCLSPRFCGIIRQQFLLKIHGEESIFAVFVEGDDRKVSVFRLSYYVMKWELVEDLVDKMLFVSHSASFAAPNKSMTNRIYFPIFHDDKSVFYSLNTRKYHSIDGNYIDVNAYGLKELHFATWYRPLPTGELLKRSTSWTRKLVSRLGFGNSFVN